MEWSRVALALVVPFRGSMPFDCGCLARTRHVVRSRYRSGTGRVNAKSEAFGFALTGGGAELLTKDAQAVCVNTTVRCVRHRRCHNRRQLSKSKPGERRHYRFQQSGSVYEITSKRCSHFGLLIATTINTRECVSAPLPETPVEPGAIIAQWMLRL